MVCPVHDDVNRIRRALNGGFYGAVATVAYPAGNPKILRFAPHRVAEKDALHVTMNDEVQRFQVSRMIGHEGLQGTGNQLIVVMTQ